MKFNVKDNCIEVSNGSKSIFVTIVTEDIINISDGIKSDFKQDKDKIKSNVKFEVLEKENSIKTNKFLIKVDNLVVDIYDLKNNPLCVNYQKDIVSKKIEASEAAKIVGHVVDEAAINNENMIKIKTSKDSLFFGLGDKPGFFNRRGYEYVNQNADVFDPHLENMKNIYKSVPFFIVKEPNFNYGIFFDNTYKSNFDFCYTSEEYYFFGAEKGSKDYYFIFGDGLKDVVSNYTLLTGRSPLPQLWTLGYQQSRWGYENENDVYKLVELFEYHKVPLEVVYLDIDYMEAYKSFTISKERFPNFKKLVSDLKAKGIKIVTIIDPGVKAEKGYYVYDEGIENNCFATIDGEVYENVVWPGDSVYPSYVSAKVRKWWGEKINFLLDLGVAGIWNDMNEPASFKGPLPDDVVFSGDDKQYLHEEVHNIYGHYMCEATYEGLLNYDGKRPFVLTRACFSGTQKYSTFWTGDNHSIWAHIQLAIPQQISLGLSGLAVVGTDIGGFGSNTTKELLCRWIQLGIFSPLCRNHAGNSTRLQEPYQFDQETIDIYKEMVELRYNLTPYLYNLLKEHEETGLPVIRPLLMHYENDKNTYNMNDQFLFGENMLVCPVVNQGDRNKRIYIPEGDWYDYFTKKKVPNGYSIYDAPLNTIPMFVKGGTIIPEYKNVLNLDNPEKIEELYLNCFGDSKCVHYQDNATDFKYQNNEYNLYEFTVKGNKLTTKMLHNGYKEYKSIKIK